jgi:hypothetical protein
VSADIVRGNLSGVGTDPWAAAQVDARRGRPVAAVVAEWDEHGPALEAMTPQLGAAGGQLIADAVAHEHDIRGALDAPGARDSDAIAIAFAHVTTTLTREHDDAAHAGFVVHHEGGRTVVGNGPPAAELAATRFEVVRAATGRRSLDQIAAYEWDGGVAPELLVLARFTARPTPLEE